MFLRYVIHRFSSVLFGVLLTPPRVGSRYSNGEDRRDLYEPHIAKAASLARKVCAVVSFKILNCFMLTWEYLVKKNILTNFRRLEGPVMNFDVSSLLDPSHEDDISAIDERREWAFLDS